MIFLFRSARRCSLLALFFGLLSPLFGQVDLDGNPVGDVHEEAKATWKASKKNVLLFSPSYLLQGDVAFSYERLFSPHWSVEGGAGVLLPFYAFGWSDLVSDDQEYLRDYSIDGRLELGYSLQAAGRYYVGGNAPDGMFLGIMTRYRNYQLENDFNYRIWDVVATYGVRVEVWETFVWENVIGLGPRSQEVPIFPSSVFELEPDPVPFAFVYQFKLGYAF